MSITRTKALWLCIACALVAATWWVVENYELEEVTYPGMPKGEAVRNPLFAAQRLAERLGVKAGSRNGFRNLTGADPHGSVVVITTGRRTMTSRQRDELLAWISAGGHLVTVTYSLERSGNKPDPLMLAIGVRQTLTAKGKAAEKLREIAASEETDDDDEARKARDSEKRRQARKEMEKLRRQFPMLPGEADNCPQVRIAGSDATRVANASSVLKVCFDDQFHVDSDRPKLWAVSSAQGTHALAVPHGAGRVTVLTDYDFMTNNRIGKADHADMLAAMLGLNDASPPRGIVFISREDVDNIFVLTWKYAAPVVLVLAAWLLLGLWRVASRFGPVQVPSPARRRSLAEHVRASGEYLWRHGQSTLLWRATKGLTERRIERVLPAASFPNADAHLHALARRSGIDANHLETILHAAHPPAPEAFANTIATLNQLRNAL
jgi:hypothetical protein